MQAKMLTTLLINSFVPSVLSNEFMVANKLPGSYISRDQVEYKNKIKE